MAPLNTRHTAFSRSDALVLLGFLLFLLLFFSEVLVQPGEYCLGRVDGDARNQFYGWRAYGFGQIREGRFPLWNPYEFLGMPFVAGLQSAMFYPTNWLCAVLPFGRAINIGIIVNLFLSGLFTYLWGRRLGLRWPGAVVAATAYTFGAPQLLRIFEGHWSFLACMPWIPCILWCLEIIVTGGPWALATAGGALALAMQLFGGNPQYAFYGGIAALVYFAGRLFMERARGMGQALRAVAAFGIIYVLGTLLAGVQMAPAYELLSISARKGQLTLGWVSKFSWVPEAFPTLVAPDFMGSDMDVKFWARWNLWEMSAYVGVVAFALALIGFARNRRNGVALLAGGAVVFFSLLALGGNAPLLPLLYKLVPGFDLFRSQARFLCPMSLFLALLAGMGMDAVAAGAHEEDGRRIARGEIAAVLAGAVLLAGVGLSMVVGAAFAKSTFVGLIHWVWRHGLEEVHYLRNLPKIAEIQGPALFDAGWSILRGGAFLSVLGGVLLMARYRRPWTVAATVAALAGLAVVMGLTAHVLVAVGLGVVAVTAVALWVAASRCRAATASRCRAAVMLGVLLGVIGADMWSYGRRYMVMFNPYADGLTPGAVEAMRKLPGPYRWARGGCFTFAPCEGMTYGFACLEGVQPNAPALFRDVFWTFQGLPRQTQITSYAIRNLFPEFRMLNLAYFVCYRDTVATKVEGIRTIYADERIRIDALPGPWPRAWLVHRYEVVPQDEECLARLRQLNYEQAALLEADPQAPMALSFARESSPAFLRCEPQRVTLEAEPASDGLLILSDLYYPGWRAAVDGEAVDILRANYCMRAVPLTAGKHTVEFTYEPASFRLGLAASLAGLLGVALLILFHVRMKGKGGA